MDLPVYSPLLDLFRRGETSKDVRLLAARNAITLRTVDQFALLVFLTGDADPEVVSAAQATLVAMPRDVVWWYFAQPDALEDVIAFYTTRGIRPPEPKGEVQVETPPAEPEADAGAVDEEPPPDEEVRKSVVEKIAVMNVAERITVAMKGTREERAILIRDPNKIVGAAVLSSPKLSETEVESIARMATVSEDVLRMIGHSRAWTKNYSIMLSLVKNPKTPLAMSMNFLGRVNDKDLRVLSTSRNIPEVLRVSAQKKLVLNK